MGNIDDLILKIDSLGTITIDVKSTHGQPKLNIIEFKTPPKIKEIFECIVEELKNINKRIDDLDKKTNELKRTT